MSLRLSKQLRLSISGEDRISALPDSLLHHILSFFPTKFAATTSILSKRWKTLWLSQLILNFNDRTFPQASTFSNFINSVIADRDKTLPILSFHLKCRRYHNIDYIPNFLCTAFQGGVKNLNIDLCYLNYTLPSSVLTTKTLSVLKLKGIILDKMSEVDLPLLKVLNLRFITFARYEILSKLLSGCPILQDLETKCLRVKSPYSEKNRQVINLPNLVTANICNQFTPIEFDWFHNVERLRANVKHKEKFLYTLDHIAMFHNLTHMELIFLTPMWKFKSLMKLLEYCPKLQSLIIDDEILKPMEFCDEDWKEPQIIPKCLLSHLTTCSLRNYKDISCELHFAKYIMKNSRVLRAMTIQSAKLVDTNTKLQMLMKLSLCLRNSATCKLLFI